VVNIPQNVRPNENSPNQAINQWVSSIVYPERSIDEQWSPRPLRAANLVISTVDGIKPLPPISSQVKNCNQPHETDLDVMSEKHSGRNGNLWKLLQVVRDACLLWWSSSNHGKVHAKISFLLKSCKHILVPWCLHTLTGLVVSCNLDNEDLITKHMFNWKRKSWTSVSKVKNPNAFCVTSLHNAHWRKYWMKIG